MMRKIPKHITLILNETDNIFLLELPSSIVPREGIELEKVEADNQLYDFLTSDKGRNRKVNTVSVQTIPLLLKTRHTEPIHYECKDNFTFASNWVMYDTYNIQIDEEIIEEDDSEIDFLLNEEEIEESIEHKLNEEISINDVKKSANQKELEKLLENKNYFDAVLVIERLLANNCYNEEQKKFKGIMDNNKETDEIKYDYKLDLLWTFANEDTKSRCVTGISFNNFNEEIIAVSYGKYYFIDRKNTGIVMIWNIKNPKQPEREYYFRFAVTSLAFSNQTPAYLTVGFYNGDVIVIDISKRDLFSIGEDKSTSFEAALDILWLEKTNDFLVCFGDGKICKFHLTETQMESTQIMRIEKIEGKLKGLHSLRLFQGNQVSSSRYPSTVCLSLNSSNPLFYLVATNEGIIHICSIHYSTQHKSMFKAHEGRIHRIKFSPFVEEVFGTCGDDFQKCFWIHGIDEPLIVSRYRMDPVLDFEWSPSHSTIIVSLRGMDIFVWDFQRKIYSPQSQTKSPTNSLNTFCKFTPSGRCLLVGDIDGNVHVFSISNLPIPAFFQKNLFFQSIKNILRTNTNLTTKLQKLEIYKNSIK